jgi:arylsulfatase A-like enzyme
MNSWSYGWKRGLIVAASLLAVSVPGCKSERGPTLPRAKHVLVLTIDTLRPDYMSFNAYDRPTTPSLDRLMREGLYFDRAVTPIPRTTQALASMLTGCYPHTTKVRSLVGAMSPDVVSIAQMAREAGYRTVAVVSNHMLGPQRGLDRGFEVYDQDADIRDAQLTTDAAIRRLSTLRPDEHIFAWVHYIDPHVPYTPPLPLVKEFSPDYNGPYATHFGSRVGGIGDAAYPPDLPKRIAVHRNPLAEEVNAHVRRLYAADIRFADEAVERLLQWLAVNLGDDWLILFAADHGESLGEHDFYFDHGDYVYQATLRVPLAFILPRGHPLRRVGRCPALVSLVDVMPTLAELMRLPMPNGLPYEIEGRSLVPYLRGQSLEPRAAFAECGVAYFPQYVRRRVRFDVAGRFRSVIDGDWKLIWTPGQSEDLEYELYNLADDPHETRNLYVPSHPQAQELKKLLSGWLRAMDDVTRAPTEQDLEALRLLGYLE